ncbi:hypothetical protein JYU34_022338 [Plutella xylostella]|uniref:Uncharacterized protein n=1 Tax=Plutella xylostella TaxID=51655 RepID=A0ABQ7PUK2_PLUXY|nr:hypothetical protein JYU34_022338 [Plutella xylostella]
MADHTRSADHENRRRLRTPGEESSRHRRDASVGHSSRPVNPQDLNEHENQIQRERESRTRNDRQVADHVVARSRSRGRRCSRSQRHSRRRGRSRSCSRSQRCSRSRRHSQRRSRSRRHSQRRSRSRRHSQSRSRSQRRSPHGRKRSRSCSLVAEAEQRKQHEDDVPRNKRSRTPTFSVKDVLDIVNTMKGGFASQPLPLPAQAPKNIDTKNSR